MSIPEDKPDDVSLEGCAACEQEAYFRNPEITAEEMEAANPPVLYHTCKKKKGH